MDHLISKVEQFFHPFPPVQPLHEVLKDVPENISDLTLKYWDKGVFNHELVTKDIAPTPKSDTGVTGQLKEGTYDGTETALTEMFNRIERGYGAYLAAMGLESEIPQNIPFEEKYSMYHYQDPSKDKYPPHLDVIPTKDQTSQFKIFNALGLFDAAVLLPKIVPDTFINKVALEIDQKFLSFLEGDPEKGINIAQIEKNNRIYRKSATDIMRGANIGDLSDWYSDARFAQQYLTGTNPTTITGASQEWIGEFRKAASSQQLTEVVKLLDNADPKSLYITDNSYFRKVVGVSPDMPLIQEDPTGNKHACASVTLFELAEDGRLHPLAIIIDYRVSTEESVVIFNRRLSPFDSTSAEKEDWPWRFAKTCAQSSDWIVHELTVHLTRTHLIEETTIVATHRCIPEDHIVFQLLSPHWLKTLSLNAAARETLVPKIILDLMGFPKDTGYTFIKDAYHAFDFEGSYVPKDLEKRGFPVADINKPKYRNCGYAQDMILMWNAIRSFVANMISLQFKTDENVAKDDHIRAWYRELQDKNFGQISTFPTITTVDGLIDAVTMCIHIASPQHTSINYLQNYYQAFVINKPPALFQPLPSSLSELKNYTERDLVAALPIGRQRQWLLAATIPWLLSFRPADENSLINYAASLWNLYKFKPEKEFGPEIKAYAESFYNDLRQLVITFRANSDGMTQGTVPYEVMNPATTAVAIVI